MQKSALKIAINYDHTEMARKRNPAKWLHLADRLGSYKTGKVACFVIWSANPFSAYDKVKKIFNHGNKLRDLDELLNL